MTATLRTLVERFRDLRVLVIGDAMLDSYVVGHSSRLCQEAPAPVIAVQERQAFPGGAANTALNLAALGCRVELASVIGADHEGDELRALLMRGGVQTGLVMVDPARRTLAKQRIVNGGELLARVDQGDTAPISSETLRHLRSGLDAAFVRADAVVISDYGYGVLTPEALGHLRVLQRRFRQIVAVDARDLCQYQPLGVTLVKPNYMEALALAGNDDAPALAVNGDAHRLASNDGLRTLAGDDDVPSSDGVADAVGARSRLEIAREIAGRILDLTGAQLAAITLDADGALLAERGRPPHHVSAHPADQSNTAGAGDTFLAALSLALAAEAAPEDALRLAALAASIVVQQPGTTICHAAELYRLLGGTVSGAAPGALPASCPGPDAVTNLEATGHWPGCLLPT